MSEKILNTRIQLKYDSYDNWSTNNPTLKQGEVAFATIESNTGSNKDDIKNAPSVLIKVGDGLNKYNDLKFVSALAADVIEACKSEATLKTFINNVIAEAGIATDEALTALSNRVTTAEDEIKTLTSDNSTEGSIAKSIKDAIDTLNTELENIYATKAEAQGYANAKDEAITAAKKAGDDAQADVDALETTVSGVDERVAAIEEDYLKTADKEALQTQIDTIMNNPDTEGVINSINEFTQYIEDHGEVAEGFKADIDKNKADIAANAKAIADQATADEAKYETKEDATAKLGEAKAYADGLAGNYATAEQGATADSALQEITTTLNAGLKVTNKNQIDIDDEVVFVFDCGTASINI